MKFLVKSLSNISMAEPNRRYLVPGYQVTVICQHLCDKKADVQLLKSQPVKSASFPLFLMQVNFRQDVRKALNFVL